MSRNCWSAAGTGTPLRSRSRKWIWWKMKLVVLLRAVLDDPVLHRALRRGDRGWVSGAEKDGSLPIHRDEELLVGVVFGEEEHPVLVHERGLEPGEALRSAPLP